MTKLKDMVDEAYITKELAHACQGIPDNGNGCIKINYVVAQGIWIFCLEEKPTFNKTLMEWEF